MSCLTANQNATLDQAFANAVATRGGVVSGYTSVANFLTNYNSNGAAFIAGMNLGNADTGAVGGLDADAGAAKTATSVVNDVGMLSGSNVLNGFTETFEAISTGNGPKNLLTLQIGSEAQQTLDVSLGAANAAALDLLAADVTTNASQVIQKMDSALDYINGERARIGAQSNRLDSTIDNLAVTAENLSSSRSRILDADYARQSAALSRAQVMQQAAMAMVAQANTSGRDVLALLRQ